MKWITAIFILGLTLLNLDSAYCQERYIDPEAFEKSYALWQEQKKKHNNSYVLTLAKSSIFGWSGTTKLVIKEGVVVKRSYSEQHFSPPKKWKPTKWKEKGKNLGKHEDGYGLITLDDIYARAKHYLPKPVVEEERATDDEKGEIGKIMIGVELITYFEAEHDGLVSTVGSRIKGCMDDCFRGYSVRDIKWLE